MTSKINNYPLNRLFLLLQQKECNHIYCRYTKDSSYYGVLLFFQKKRGIHDDFSSLGDVP